MYPAIKQIIVSFSLNMWFTAFFLDCFFSFIYLFIFFFDVFAILCCKCSNNFFSVKIMNNICPQHSYFNFFNYKNFLRPIWGVTFSKKIFFWYSNNSNFKFRNFIINFFSRASICVWFYLNRFHFSCAICIIGFFHYI